MEKTKKKGMAVELLILLIKIVIFWVGFKLLDWTYKNLKPKEKISWRCIGASFLLVLAPPLSWGGYMVTGSLAWWISKNELVVLGTIALTVVVLFVLYYHFFWEDCQQEDKLAKIKKKRSRKKAKWMKVKRIENEREWEKTNR